MQTNFPFLTAYPALFKTVTLAERYCVDDPNTALIKLRQFGEMLAQMVAVQHRLPRLATQNELLKALKQLPLDREILNIFHFLKNAGNEAVHENAADSQKAVIAFAGAWQLGLWFVRAFDEQMSDYQPKAFDPKLLQEVKLSEPFAISEQEIEQVQESELQQTEQKLASQSETEQAEFDRKRDNRLFKANHLRDLDERQTRLLIIDQQLNQAGWLADTENLTYAKGVRPEKGKNIAIAEYPLPNGERADYLLFCGLTPMAAVEAKKQNKNVAGSILQAERYARHFRVENGLNAPWERAKRTVAWAADLAANDGTHFYLPFVYACNGRAYHKQIEELSGTWFRDLRQVQNLKRALSDFHTPSTLWEMLHKDEENAQQKLAEEPFEYLKLRDYQIKAIQAVETSLQAGKRQALIAMATGTGKTRTIAGLIYRLLKADRFRRILFLVDRTSLADQANDTFNEMPMEQGQTLKNFYNFAENGDVFPETKIKVATVQAMVKQIFHSDDAPSIDQFDCIIVDEAHRGYTLDQEMTDGEIAFRDNEQYLSTYRRVLDYFDAVKIGLTATPALHTTEIFGDPVFVYSYKEAVIDDYLIDHEPPFEIKTKLSQEGIHFDKAEQLEILDETGEVRLDHSPDEQHFDVETFNRSIINENFDRVICQYLSTELNPLYDEEKTLIFCVNDLHADRVVRLLNEAFAQHEGYNEKAVQKITGQTDEVDKAIKHFKNEKYPNIAVTVDLLTTGIDVPKICNLVFLRRVKSRILFEQMKGRATRKCPEIGKATFRIYDAVGLCRAMQDLKVDTMKPIVKQPNITLEYLIDELKTLNGKGAVEQQDDTLQQISQRVMRMLRKAEKSAENNENVAKGLAVLQQEWGIEPSQLHQHLRQNGIANAIAFFDRHPNFAGNLQWLSYEGSFKTGIIITDKEDRLLGVSPLFPKGETADDYLQQFVQFIQSNQNELTALQVIANRPWDLTRQQLKEIELTLNAAGFSKLQLDRALSNKTNQKIAAGIIAHIRRAALGDSLIPFEYRVDKAMQKILSQHHWTGNQEKWLERLAKQIKNNYEEILDRHRFNELLRYECKEFKDNLDNLVCEVNENLWRA